MHDVSVTDSLSAAVTSRPRPPFVKGLPLLGNVLDMAADPEQFFVRCYQTYGPIFRIRIFNQPYTVLAGPDANLFMAREGDTHLRSREFWQGMLDEFGASQALINTDGEIHAQLRAVMKDGFARSAIVGREAELIAITDDMLARDWSVGQTVAVVPAMQRMAAEQLGIMVAGQAPGDYVDDLRNFIRIVLNVLVTRQRPRFFLRLPTYRRAKARVFELGRRLMRDFDPAALESEQRSLMADIMRAAQDPTLFPGEAELMMAVTGPYFAGLDTVANTTSAMLYAVLKHPSVYARVMQEVDAAFAAGPVNWAALRRMPALHGAVMETLRMYPIAVAAMRNATQDFEFGGYQVVEGEPLYMAITVSHYLPEFYPEPYTFDIDRFGHERAEHKQKGAFAPFSLGAHTCLGAGMAEVQIMLTLATLLHRLELQLSPPDYTLKQKAAPTPGPELKFAVQVTGRRG